MFFDATKPLCLKGFRAIYVFCLIHADLREVLQKLNSGSTLPKTRRRAADSTLSTARLGQRDFPAKEDAIAEDTRKRPIHAGSSGVCRQRIELCQRAVTPARIRSARFVKCRACRKIPVYFLSLGFSTSQRENASCPIKILLTRQPASATASMTNCSMWSPPIRRRRTIRSAIAR